MFLKVFSVLALHPKHYGKTNVLEFIIHLKRSENRNVEYKLDNKVKMKITFATDLEVDPVEITKERRKFAGYPSAIHIMSQEKHQDQKNHQDQEKHQDQDKHQDQEKHQYQQQLQDKHQDQD